jgi:hypothetical protein
MKARTLGANNVQAEQCRSKGRPRLPDVQRVLVFVTDRGERDGLRGTTRVPDPTPDIASHLYQWHFLVVPVALSDLVAGTNTVQISNTGSADNCPTVANVDLEVVRKRRRPARMASHAPWSGADASGQ